MISNWFKFFSLTLIFVIIFPSDAHAYIDPGTGSVIISAIVFLIGSIGYYARVIILKIKNFFNNKK